MRWLVSCLSLAACLSGWLVGWLTLAGWLAVYRWSMSSESLHGPGLWNRGTRGGRAGPTCLQQYFLYFYQKPGGE